MVADRGARVGGGGRAGVAVTRLDQRDAAVDQIRARALLLYWLNSAPEDENDLPRRIDPRTLQQIKALRKVKVTK